jgi:G3E family GTPase
VCCTARGDLVGILEALSRRGDWFDRILVETSGLADPGPVARTLFADDRLRDRLRLDAVVTLVDALHIGEHLVAVGPEGAGNVAAAQIAFADRIVINKTDLVSPARLCELSVQIRAINALAPLMTVRRAAVDLDFLLGVEAFDVSRVAVADPQFLDRTDHAHVHGVGSVGIDLAGEMDPDLVERWLRELLVEQGRDIFRSKGVLSLAGHQTDWFFQGVHTLLDTEWVSTRTPEQPRRSRMVFIGRNLDRAALEAGFKSCLAAGQ